MTLESIDKALTVRCPYCKARKGKPCVFTATWPAGMAMKRVHTKRVYAAGREARIETERTPLTPEQERSLKIERDCWQARAKTLEPLVEENAALREGVRRLRASVEALFGEATASARYRVMEEARAALRETEGLVKP